ncbi:MAG: stage V sporulation protein E [Clostridia bacterium]|nr:stage V sporulation protein E [Clostridia bacterium]
MRQGKNSPDFIIFIIVLVLLTIGLVMVFSSTIYTSLLRHGDTFYYLKRQGGWAIIGLLAMFSVMKMDIYKIRKLAVPAFIFGLLLLVMVLVPGIGKEIKGSSRWLGVGSLSFQPSEVMKLIMVMFLANSLSKYHHQIRFFLKGLLPNLLVLGLVSGLIMLQPDLGTTIAIAGTSYIMFFAGGAKGTHLFGLAILGVVAVGVAIAIAPYRMERFTAFIDPWADPNDSGFQIIQSIYAIGSGGFAGLGLTKSKQKLWYVPEQHTDFIFAIISEELGFIGASIILLLFLCFAWRGIKIALTAPDGFTCLLATGVTIMIVLQAIINIGVVTGSMPVTGITLPLISYGGSSLIWTLIGVGLLLNISRYTKAR